MLIKKACSVSDFEWYFFQLIVRFNPDFNCCNSFAISSVDKVTTGTWSFVSVIANFAAWFAAALDVTQFADQVRMRLISQLINGISRVLQKLLKYFSGISILIFFVPSWAYSFLFKFKRSTIARKISIRASISHQVGSSF